jgi:hypothetical protein
LIKRVVVTGVGARPAARIVDAFKRRGWLVVGVDSEFHPQYVNQFYLVSRGDHPGFVDELVMLVRRERTTLLIPTRDIESLAIARRSHELRQLGAAVFLPDPGTIEDIVDARHVASLLRRARIDVWDSTLFPPPVMRGVSWFEVTLCRDGRFPHDSFVCAVHELEVGEGASTPRVERRKGESDVEDLAIRTAQALGLPGPSTVHVRRDAEGRVGVARVGLAPCEYAPLTDDVLDAFLALWERVQPP